MLAATIAALTVAGIVLGSAVNARIGTDSTADEVLPAAETPVAELADHPAGGVSATATVGPTVDTPARPNSAPADSDEARPAGAVPTEAAVGAEAASGTATTATVEVIEPIPATAAFRAPIHGSVIGPQPALSGVADHPAGVSHVHLIIQRLDRAIFWNPDNAQWQDRFRMFDVPVSPSGASSATWLYEVESEHPLPPGEYRARVWAASVDGNGDPIGQLVEFTVAETTDREAPSMAASLAAIDDPVSDARRRAERDGEPMPKVRIRQPENGLHRAISSIRVHARAEYEPGVESLTVQLRHMDSGRYWNFESSRWQGSPASLTTTEPLPDADHRLLAIDVWLPRGFAEPGTYEVLANATGVDGATFAEPERSVVTILDD